MGVAEDVKPIQSTLYSTKAGERGCSITFENLTKEELDKITHTLKFGCGWIRFHEGRLETVERYEEIPRPESDPRMVGFWTPKPPIKEIKLPDPGEPHAPTKFDFSDINAYSYPGILIQHLCGYNYSPERYGVEVRNLESYGFACMRSRRNNGQYWEAWFLPSLSFAKGKLAEVLEEHLACSGCGSTQIRPWNFSEKLVVGVEVRCMDCIKHDTVARVVKKADAQKDQLRRAVDFLRRRASFGTLDVVCQRLAMVME